MTHRCGVRPLCPAGAVAPGHLIEVPGCPLPGQTEPNGRWCPRSGALLPAGFAPPPGWVPWHRRVTARCRRWRHRPRAGSGRSRSSRAEGLCRGRSPLPTMAHTSGCCPRWCRWLRRRHRGRNKDGPGRAGTTGVGGGVPRGAPSSPRRAPISKPRSSISRTDPMSPRSAATRIAPRSALGRPGWQPGITGQQAPRHGQQAGRQADRNRSVPVASSRAPCRRSSTVRSTRPANTHPADQAQEHQVDHPYRHEQVIQPGTRRALSANHHVGAGSATPEWENHAGGPSRPGTQHE